ncbi:hypothetical protein AAVH_09764 [Aphelenchoides avenae]|nr:hypothetical protein AAVH_09764 [Aphelenchus avenae]
MKASQRVLLSSFLFIFVSEVTGFASSPRGPIERLRFAIENRDDASQTPRSSIQTGGHPDDAVFAPLFSDLARSHISLLRQYTSRISQEHMGLRNADDY